MASNEQSATLLRRNKRAQVDALNFLGFSLTEGARAADFPMYVKWASGLLDLNVAANRKTDNKRFFFTIEEWQSLSATEQSKFLLRGIRVRACSVSFIIAPETLGTKAWGAGDVSIYGLHSYASKHDLYSYFNAYEETCKIAEAYATVNKNNIVGAPAAEAALAYKAFTLDSDGLEDTSLWCLPTPAHLMIMFNWINEINAAFSAVWSPEFKLALSMHWSCGRYSTTHVYGLNFYGGALDYWSSSSSYSVRPICEF